MLLYIGLSLTFLLGFMLVNLLSPRFSMIEKIGLSFIVGMATQTLLMLFVDALGIPLTAFSVSSAVMFSIIVAAGLLIKYRQAELSESLHWKPDVSRLSLAWFLLLGVIVYLEYINFAKCVYFPTFDRDALDGYDAFGFLMAREHTLRHCTAFNPDYHPLNQYMIYPQLIQLSYTWVYLLGAEVSKHINALMFLSFIILFYGTMRRVTNPLASISTTLFMMVTPELMAWSSMSALNVIHAIYASMAVIYLFLWLKQGERKDFWMSILLMAFNVWARADGLAFVAGGAFVVLIDSIRKKRFRDLILWTILSLSIYILWNILYRVYGFEMQTSFIITHLFWDEEKLFTIINYIISLASNLMYYGISFPLFGIAVAANGYFVIRGREDYWIQLLWVAVMGALIVMYYQMEHWGGLQLTLESSMKRYLFCFIPVMWFYIGHNTIIDFITNRIELFQSIKKEP